MSEPGPDGPLVVEMLIVNTVGSQREKTCHRGLQTTKAQTSLCSLISTFVIHLLESIISGLARSKISFSSKTL